MGYARVQFTRRTQPPDPSRLPSGPREPRSIVSPSMTDPDEAHQLDHLPALSIEGRVAMIEFRDPARRNALDEPALRAFIDAAHRASTADGVDLVLLRGEGSAFCAGFDLEGCADEPRSVETLLTLLSEAVARLRGIDAPVVAAVQGAALAGGCAILTACDFIVVAPDAQLGYPTHRIGISPAVSVPTLLSRTEGATRAFLVANELVDGARAVELGLATHCAPHADLLASTTDALVARLLAKGPLAMRETKRWMRAIEARGAGTLGAAPARDGDAMQRARDASMALAAGDEFAAMLRAFWSARGARATQR
jgi:enoyl-CoA hydratase/carnithine racemase